MCNRVYRDGITSTKLCFVGPTDLHTVPATTTHMYGWWMKEDALKTEPWTYTERRPHVNSEMTRYVYILLLHYYCLYRAMGTVLS